MRLADLVATSERLAATRSRAAKTAELAACLRHLTPSEAHIGASFLAGLLPQGRIQLGPSALREAWPVSAAEHPTLTLREVNAALEALAASAGPGSGGERRRKLAELLGRAAAQEQHFLARLVLGELRQGALEALLLEAAAQAAAVPAAELRRAAMLAGDAVAVVAAVLAQGRDGLRHFSLKLLQPVQPMLAQTAGDVEAALVRLGPAALEFKLDGARVQVHKSGAEVRVYSRTGNEVTAAVPELVESARTLPERTLILDGEALALRSDGTPHPFQVSMRRFGRRLDVARLRATLPLSVLYFDCLHRDGIDLIDRTTTERRALLSEAVPAALLVPQVVTQDPQAAAQFFESALQQGHEGIMAKATDAPYAAGSRGSAWLKIKPAHTLDLVVLAAEWGNGRRSGWLSNLHLGARDVQNGGYVMLGKTFKGMTDAMLAWQTARLLQLEVAREAQTVYVHPELVVEVAFNDVQTSPQYPGGMALRFARVKRYREDKRSQEADTLEAVRVLHGLHGSTHGL